MQHNITHQSLAAKLILKYQMIFLQFLQYFGWIFHSPHANVYEYGQTHQCVTGLFMKAVRKPKSHFCHLSWPECWPPKHLTSQSCHFACVPLDNKDQIQIQNQIQSWNFVSVGWCHLPHNYIPTILTCHYFFVIQSIFNNTIHVTWCIIVFDESIPI